MPRLTRREIIFYHPWDGKSNSKDKAIKNSRKREGNKKRKGKNQFSQHSSGRK